MGEAEARVEQYETVVSVQCDVLGRDVVSHLLDSFIFFEEVEEISNCESIGYL